MVLHQIDRRSNLTREAFKREYLDQQKPVIITDLTKDWPALDKWTFDFFAKEYGDLMVPLVDKSFHNPGSGYMEYRKIPFREYLSAIEQGPTDLRLFLFNIFDPAPELRNDFIWPTIMDGFVKNLPFMFFGGATSVTPIHYDIDCPSNFLTHFQTRKKVILFDPSESIKLYHHPFTVQSPVDIQHPDYEKFPALKYAQGLEGTLHHGETIYIPPHWWHYIEYVDSGFSLALRAHNKWSNKFAAARNLFQHSVIDKGMNKIMGSSWKNWKSNEAIRRANTIL